MNSKQAFDYLNNFSNYEKKAHLLKPRFSLFAIKKLLVKLGDPQKSFPSIHVAGTVGKGSVCHITERVLREAGYRTALYTSPHFIDVRERIMINGGMISEQKFAAGVDRLRGIVGDNFDELTYFEMLTALAFEHFAREKVDIAIVEVGLGGRLDATNMLPPFIAVIARLGMDHAHVLGPRLSDIAGEKAGIIKRGAAVICAPQAASAARVIRETCDKKKAEFIQVKPERILKHLGSERGKELYELRFRDSAPMRAGLPLPGDFQTMNLAVAVKTLEAAAARGFEISPQALVSGIGNVNFPGRMEWVDRGPGRPALLLDGAHNEPAARALAESLPSRAGARSKVVLVAGAMRDKDADSILREMSAAAGAVVVCGLPHDRAFGTGEMAVLAKRHFKKVVSAAGMKEALAAAEKIAKKDGVICVTGSLYAVAEAKMVLRKDK